MVAQGATQTEAYSQVYGGPDSKAKRNTHSRHAAELMKRPFTRAQVAVYQEQLLPIGTLKQEIEFCLRNLKGLACESEDDKVRLLATCKLLEICERREATERELAAVSKERAQVVADLSALYRKALEQPVIEPVVDAEVSTLVETVSTTVDG
jgi:hypothetical protein